MVNVAHHSDGDSSTDSSDVNGNGDAAQKAGDPGIGGDDDKDDDEQDSIGRTSVSVVLVVSAVFCGQS